MSDRTVTLTTEELEALMVKTVHATLVGLGIEVAEPITMQKDFAWLRAWRESSEQVKRTGFLAIVTMAATGLAGMLWLSFRNGGGH